MSKDIFERWAELFDAAAKIKPRQRYEVRPFALNDKCIIWDTYVGIPEREIYSDKLHCKAIAAMLNHGKWEDSLTYRELLNLVGFARPMTEEDLKQAIENNYHE